MKILLRKASDYNEVKVIEVNNLIDLKDIYTSFIINFFKDEDFVEIYGEYDIEATIYDDYVE